MKKPIFIGAEFFERIIEEDCFYVDKTLFIKELLDNKGTVTLITRPRRFGKTFYRNDRTSLAICGTIPCQRSEARGHHGKGDLDNAKGNSSEFVRKSTSGIGRIPSNR